MRAAGILTGLLLAALACSDIVGNEDRVIAIALDAPLIRSVEEGSTLQLTAAALNAAGDTVAGADIVWAVLDTGMIGFNLDEATGTVVALFPDTARVQARVEALRSGPLEVQVTGAPDSVEAAGDVRILVPVAATVSAPMRVSVLDLTSVDGEVRALPGKRVVFEVVSPASTERFLLALGEDDTPADSSRLETATAANGQATAVIRKIPGPSAPDSVIVDATAFTADSQEVAGSPVTFIVVLESVDVQ